MVIEFTKRWVSKTRCLIMNRWMRMGNLLNRFENLEQIVHILTNNRIRKYFTKELSTRGM